MNIEFFNCPICGCLEFKSEENTYQCTRCKANLNISDFEKDAQDFESELQGIVDENQKAQKIQEIADLRFDLYKSTHQRPMSRIQINACAERLKEKLPNDLLANFFYNTTNSQVEFLNFFTNNNFTDQNPQIVSQIVEFLLKSPKLLINNIPTQLNYIINTTYNKSSIEWNKYYKRFNDLIEKIDGDWYNPALPRDVFISYADNDSAIVNDITKYLENKGLKCFVSLRNIKQESETIEKNESDLQTAMNNCKVFLFISSRSSRDKNCDAITKEMKYIKHLNCKTNQIEDIVDDDAKKYRVEYIVNDFNNQNITDLLVEAFFTGYKRTFSKEILANIILDYCANYNITNDNTEAQTKDTENTLQEEFNNAMIANEIQETAIMQQYNDIPNTEMDYTDGEIDLSNLFILPNSLKIEKRIEQEVFITKGNAKPTSDIVIPKYVYFANNICYIDDDLLEKAYGKNPDVCLVVGIGVKAFAKCKDISSITIPNSIKKIGNKAFHNCDGLENVYYNGTIADWCNIEFDGQYTNPMYYSEHLFINKKELTSITSQDLQGVTSIGYNTFAYCNTLVEVSLPQSITSIHYGAFTDCININQIVIPNSVSVIGQNAFFGCRNLEIYCEAENKPKDWYKDWNLLYYGKIGKKWANTIWGYKGN